MWKNPSEYLEVKKKAKMASNNMGWRMDSRDT
jgi:hypothetical protein